MGTPELDLTNQPSDPVILPLVNRHRLRPLLCLMVGRSIRDNNQIIVIIILLSQKSESALVSLRLKLAFAFDDFYRPWSVG